jgi:hypothetical protein
MPATKADIDTLLSTIADDPKLTKYLKTELDKLEKRQVIRNVVNNTKLRFCENSDMCTCCNDYEEEEEDTEGSGSETESEQAKKPD